jgi:hypothetical protein
MKDGNLFHKSNHLFLFGLFTFFKDYSFFYKISPRKYKVHRSLHAPVFFAISLYIPYRYNEQLNTLLFMMTKSSNRYLNLIVRVPAKLLIYGGCVMVG